MAIYYRQVDDSIIISGKTYPYKDLIKSFGGRFQGSAKVWMLPTNPETLDEVHKLCKSVGGGPVKEPKTSDNSHLPKVPVKTSDQPEAAQLAPQGMTVAELMAKIHLEIQHSFPQALWVYGEVQGLNQRKSGDYFQLADSKEQGSKSATVTANVTLWQSSRKAIESKIKVPITEILQEGLKVRLLVQVGLYQDRGFISLNLLDIDPNFTKGALALAREELLRELRSKGLDRKNKELAATSFPFHVGLISADQSRAQSDFLDQLKMYRFPGQISFYPAQMQGEKTVAEVSAGLASLASKNCDYIVITRGGGSQADLRWFDDRELALAIAHCPVPVIAAIGHHDDVCVAEELAFWREKTPTAAADFIIGRFSGARERIERCSQLLMQMANSLWSKEQERALALAASLQANARHSLSESGELIAGLTGHLHRIGQRLVFAQEQALSRRQMQLQHLALSKHERGQHQLQALGSKLRTATQEGLSRLELKIQHTESHIVRVDPQPWLKQGWTQLFQHGRRIKFARDLDASASVKARIVDAQLILSVDDIAKG